MATIKEELTCQSDLESMYWKPMHGGRSSGIRVEPIPYSGPEVRNDFCRHTLTFICNRCIFNKRNVDVIPSRCIILAVDPFSVK
jgi:hypothetical protein